VLIAIKVREESNKGGLIRMDEKRKIQEVVSLEKLEERIMPSAHAVLTPEFLASLMDGSGPIIASGSYDSFSPGGGENR
jgi:hypothetical protein